MNVPFFPRGLDVSRCGDVLKSTVAETYDGYSHLGDGTIVAVAHPEVDPGGSDALALSYGAASDRFGRVLDQDWAIDDAGGGATVDGFTYTYDANSNRTSRLNAVAHQSGVHLFAASILICVTLTGCTTGLKPATVGQVTAKDAETDWFEWQINSELTAFVRADGGARIDIHRSTVLPDGAVCRTNCRIIAPVDVGEMWGLFRIIRMASRAYLDRIADRAKRSDPISYRYEYHIEKDRAAFQIASWTRQRNPIFMGLERQVRVACHVALAEAVVSQIDAERLVKASRLQLACQEYARAVEAYVEWAHARAAGRT